MAAAWIIADHTAEEIAREAADRGLTRVYVTMDTPRDELVFWSLEDAIEYIETSMPEWIADGLSSPENVGVGEAEVICSYIAKKDLQYCKKLKLMILDIAGVDGFIDSPYFPPDAVICNGSGYYGNLIAEHSVALALAICRGLPVYVQHQ